MPEANAQETASERAFKARIEAIRGRFAAKFVAGMDEIAADLSRMAGEGAAPADVIANAHRWFHEICGIASTIGFASTGLSARSCHTILIGPHRARRGLSAAELAQLTELIDSLRLAARAEMQIPDSNWGQCRSY